MIQQIKRYINKYHNPELWLETMRIREEKKQAVQQVVTFHQVAPVQQVVLEQQPKTIFRKSEKLYGQEDANMIRKIYDELEEIVRIPTISFG